MSTVTITPTVLVVPIKKPPVRLVVGAIIFIAVVFMTTCLLSWYVVQPGESLFGPTVLATTMMGATAFSSHLALRGKLAPRPERIFWSIVAALCLAAPVWTSVGVLQVSLRLDSSATRTAQGLIASRSSTCHIVNTGSVGVLRAPYEVCAKDYPGYGYRVNFTTLDEGRGYAYIQGRSQVSWFPNQCAAHLFGDWWAFNASVNTANASCPMGFPENGAG